MEKVVNSVQQILGECKKMIEQTDGCEYVDIKGLAKSLGEECEVLRQYFELSPEDERNIRNQKQKIERLAIRLEFYMSMRLGLYKDRKKLRDFAGTLYTDCRGITMVLYGSGADKTNVIEWAANTNWALSFYSRSLHIIFETGEEDEKKIKNITENMKIMKGRLNYG